mgnify:CR=1 FL=1
MTSNGVIRSTCIRSVILFIGTAMWAWNSHRSFTVYAIWTRSANTVMTSQGPLPHVSHSSFRKGSEISKSIPQIVCAKVRLLRLDPTRHPPRKTPPLNRKMVGMASPVSLYTQSHWGAKIQTKHQTRYATVTWDRKPNVPIGVACETKTSRLMAQCTRPVGTGFNCVVGTEKHAINVSTYSCPNCTLLVWRVLGCLIG